MASTRPLMDASRLCSRISNTKEVLHLILPYRKPVPGRSLDPMKKIPGRTYRHPGGRLLGVRRVGPARLRFPRGPARPNAAAAGSPSSQHDIDPDPDLKQWKIPQLIDQLRDSGRRTSETVTVDPNNSQTSSGASSGRYSSPVKG